MTPKGEGELYEFVHGATAHCAIVLIGKEFHAFPLHDIEYLGCGDPPLQ
jgi:hypothetical protein